MSEYRKSLLQEDGSTMRVYHVPASEMYDEPHPNWKTVAVVRVDECHGSVLESMEKNTDKGYCPKCQRPRATVVVPHCRCKVKPPSITLEEVRRLA